MTAGEHVQLPFYLLTLAEPVTQALFLSLNGSRISDSVRLEGQVLQRLSNRVRQRLFSVQQSLHGGADLPAWGDDRTCERCQMQGLCRKQMWLELEEASNGTWRDT